MERELFLFRELLLQKNRELISSLGGTGLHAAVGAEKSPTYVLGKEVLVEKNLMLEIQTGWPSPQCPPYIVTPQWSLQRTLDFSDTTSCLQSALLATILYELHTNEIAIIITAVLQMKEPRLREGKWLVANVAWILSSTAVIWTTC